MEIESRRLYDMSLECAKFVFKVTLPRVSETGKRLYNARMSRTHTTATMP